MLGVIHIPKNAGSSIKSWLRQHKVAHMSFRHLQLCELDTVDLEQAMTWIAVVRNPFDRVISQYEFSIIKATRMLAKHKTVLPHLARYQEMLDLYYQGFSVWLREYHIINPRFSLTQHSYLSHPAGGKIDLVLRFEDLAEEWKTVQSITEIDQPLPHIKASKRKANFYLTEDDKRYIRSKYHEDFEMLGYPLEWP